MSDDGKLMFLLMIIITIGAVLALEVYDWVWSSNLPEWAKIYILTH